MNIYKQHWRLIIVEMGRPTFVHSFDSMTWHNRDYYSQERLIVSKETFEMKFASFLAWASNMDTNNIEYKQKKGEVHVVLFTSVVSVYFMYVRHVFFVCSFYA